MNYLPILLIKCLGLLPLGLVRVLGAWIGSLVWLLQGRAAQTTLTNLELCFPELTGQQRRQLARMSLQETAKTAAEAGLIWRHSWAWLEQKIMAKEGHERLTAKLAKGNGVLVLAPHLGNWEVLGPYLDNMAQFTAMYQPLRNPQVDQLVLAGRSRPNSHMAPTNARGVRQLLQALRQGGIVMMLPDQVPDETAGGLVAPFFGQPALTMNLVYGLIQRTGCELCCCYAERVPGGFKIAVTEPSPKVFAENPVDAATGLNESIELCVRRAPAQYQWEYKRFRSLPPPAVEPYRQ